MPRSEINALTLIAIFFAASSLGNVVPGSEPWMLTQPLAGIVLLIVLFSFDREGNRNSGQSLGFGAVAGYCAARVLVPLLPLLNGLAPLPWFSIVWILATLACWAVDISRMGKRAATQPYPAGTPMPQAGPAAPQPRPMQEAPVSTTFAPPVPAPASATSLFSQPPQPFAAPAPFQPSRPPTPPPPMEAVADTVVAIPLPVPTPPPPAPAPPPAAVAIPKGSGKPATIYLNLMGEGLAVLRSVQAEHIGKDFYLIVEPIPPGETWQFQPGQVVRCQKRSLSHGKALVAIEEAPRAS